METEKMEIFKTIKQNFVSIGFTKRNEKFHTEQLIRTLEGFLAIVLQCLYIVFDARTAKEYMFSIVAITIGIFVYIAYLSTVLRTEKIFIYIDYVEEIISGSEFSSYNSFH